MNEQYKNDDNPLFLKIEMIVALLTLQGYYRLTIFAWRGRIW